MATKKRRRTASAKRPRLKANRAKHRKNAPKRVTRKRASTRRKKNPVRVSASMAGKSTGWMPAKAVRVVRAKGGKVRVDVKR